MSDSQNKEPNSGRYGGLRPWKPGQSGNPGGRPKLNAALRQKCRDLDEESLAALRAALAVPGERVSAAKVLLAYGHGAPESKPIADEDEAEPTGGKVTPAKALEALTAEPRGPDDPEN